MLAAVQAKFPGLRETNDYHQITQLLRVIPAGTERDVGAFTVLYQFPLKIS